MSRFQADVQRTRVSKGFLDERNERNESHRSKVVTLYGQGCFATFEQPMEPIGWKE